MESSQCSLWINQLKVLLVNHSTILQRKGTTMNYHLLFACQGKLLDQYHEAYDQMM